MRRTISAVVLAVLAFGLPAAEAKPKPQKIGARTYVFGVGTATAEVTVPKGAVLRASTPVEGAPRFAEFWHEADWSAIALLGRGPKPVRLMQVRTSGLDHCPSTLAIEAGRCRDIEHVSVTGTTLKGSGAAAGYPIPAGTYQLVVSGPPDEFSIAMLEFSGVKGVRGVVADRAAKAAFQRVRAEDTLHAEADGAFTHKVTGNAVALLGSWHVTSSNQNGAYYVAQCVTPGAPAPLDAESCAARREAAAAAPAAAPVFATSDAGQAKTPLGYATHVTPVLKPGTYTNSYRVDRVGHGPAAGAFVWWLQADSLR